MSDSHLKRILGFKTSEWEAVVAADSNSLIDNRSAKNVDQILKNAGSRSAQKLLSRIIKEHIPAMLSNRSGCAIISSLIKYGTKSSVSAVAPLVLEEVKIEGSSPAQMDILLQLLRRRGCAPQEESKIEIMAKDIYKQCSTSAAACRLFATVCATNNNWEKFEKEIKALVSASGDSTKNAFPFIESLVVDPLTGEALDGPAELVLSQASVKSRGNLVALIASKGSKGIIDAIAAQLMETNFAVNPGMLEAVPHVLKGASEKYLESIALSVAAASKKLDKTTPHLAEALVMATRRCPKIIDGDSSVSAEVLKWERSHVPASLNTRHVVMAKLAEKRRREAESEKN